MDLDTKMWELYFDVSLCCAVCGSRQWTSSIPGKTCRNNYILNTDIYYAIKFEAAGAEFYMKWNVYVVEWK